MVIRVLSLADIKHVTCLTSLPNAVMIISRVSNSLAGWELWREFIIYLGL